MGDEFWSFLTLLLREHGLLSVLAIGELGIIVYLFKLVNKREGEKTKLQERLLELSERRLEDAKEEREDYETLARDLDTHINLLIKVFRKYNGDNGHSSDEEIK